MAWVSSIKEPSNGSYVGSYVGMNNGLKFPSVSAAGNGGGSGGYLELWLKIKRITFEFSTESVVTDSSTGSVTTTTKQFSGVANQRYPIFPEPPAGSGVLPGYFSIRGQPWEGVFLGAPQSNWLNSPTYSGSGRLSFTAVGTGNEHYNYTYPSMPDVDSDTPFTSAQGGLAIVPWTFEGEFFGDPNYQDTHGDMRNSLWYPLMGINYNEDGGTTPIPWADFDEGWVHSDSGSHTTTVGTITSAYTYSYTVNLATS